ncbi:MAG: LacI family transcriptional regulator [Lachnospiraceae bacterium]|nr:LacI family transcriptional regulator [Lachnospiraceae bacterium]
MVSLKDIATRCGVSVATASKALNDHTDISVNTKRLIQDTAKEMGYNPNSSARALKTNRTFNIGVLFVDKSLNGLTHDYFSHVLDGFRVGAEKKGYDITFLSNGQEHASYLKHSMYRGFDGIVAACVNFYDNEVIELVNSDIPLVTIDHVFEHRISVNSDNKGGMEALVRHIIKSGHKKIAYIYGDDTSVTHNRIKGYEHALYESGLIPQKKYMKASRYRKPEDSYKLTKELLSLSELPTCIIFPDDYSCIGGINAITEAGLTIPDDISIAGFDGSFFSQILSPKLTTYKQASDRIGSIAAEKLIQLIESPKNNAHESIVVPGEVIKGESVCPLTL